MGRAFGPQRLSPQTMCRERERERERVRERKREIERERSVRPAPRRALAVPCRCRAPSGGGKTPPPPFPRSLNGRCRQRCGRRVPKRRGRPQGAGGGARICAVEECDAGAAAGYGGGIWRRRRRGGAGGGSDLLEGRDAEHAHGGVHHLCVCEKEKRERESE